RRIDPLKKSERPNDRLLLPGRYSIRQVEQRRFALGGGKPLFIHTELAAVTRQNAGQAFKERCFARAVRPDQAQDFPLTRTETYILQYRVSAESFGEAIDRQQIHR